MVIDRGIRRNKVLINSYGLWVVGVEISHMCCTKEEKYNEEQDKEWS